MCRMFGMLSVRDSKASKYLLEDPCSLYAQSKANPRALQSDGWGIGYYKGQNACLVKSEKPVYEEYERFASAVQQASSTIVLAHVRRASNPRGLPRTKIIAIENSQPFKYGNFLFAHNGTITIPDEAAESLGEWKQRIRSLNDSEVYFWAVVKEIAEGVSFGEALERFEKNLLELWLGNREKYLGKSRPYVGLNALFSDGERLYAYCKYDEEDESVKSLCFGDQPVLQMSYSASQEKLVVCSEKTNREDDWKPLQSGQLLVGYVKKNKVSVELQKSGKTPLH